MESNSSKDADFQKREKDASDWAMKSILVVGTASLALSTIYESYVKYCRNIGTKPLQILQLKSVLEYNFPTATVQIKEVNADKKSMFIGLELLKNSEVNQREELGDEIKFHVESSEGGMSDQESTHVPRQLIGGRSARVMIYEPFYAVEAEHGPKKWEMRRNAWKYTQEVENRCTNKTSTTLTTEDEVVEICKRDAKRLSHVMTWVKDNGHTKILLRDFAHSASCAVTKCYPFCMMFRRVRRHVVSSKHRCVLLRLYSLLLHLHVNSCNNDHCGLQACPTLKANKKSTIANRRRPPSHDTMIQRITKNPLLVSAPASNNVGNRIAVVSAIPTNKLEGGYSLFKK